MKTSNIINKKVSEYINHSGKYLPMSNDYLTRSNISKYGNRDVIIYHEYTFSFRGLKDLILVW